MNKIIDVEKIDKPIVEMVAVGGAEGRRPASNENKSLASVFYKEIEGHNMSLVCESSSNPKPIRIEWFKDDALLGNTSHLIL